MEYFFNYFQEILIGNNIVEKWRTFY